MELRLAYFTIVIVGKVNINVGRIVSEFCKIFKPKPVLDDLSVMVNVLPALFWFRILLIEGGPVNLLSQARIYISQELKLLFAFFRILLFPFLDSERRSLILLDGESSHCCK